MKAIMISIQPQWVEKILNKEKTIEIRKTMPKCELPCKIYIYCTKSKPTLQYFYNWQNYKPISEHSTWAAGRTLNVGEYGNGKVVAEFILNKVEQYGYVYSPSMFINDYRKIIDDTFTYYKLDYKSACLTREGLLKYTNDNEILPKPIYAWHIDNLKIYDKPKELSEFRQTRKVKAYNFGIWSLEVMPLTRPPQSWCFVEEL